MSVTTLTKRLVATALPKNRAYELRDTQVRGLLLRVQPSGHKAWVVTWEHGKRRTLGSAGHLTLDEAREIARKIIAEYIQTGLPSIAKPATPKITLAEFLRDHYGPWARSELKGADKYIKRLGRVFPGALDMPMSDINSAWVERWWMERLKTKARPDREGLITKATAWRDLASFRAVIAKAVKWGMLEQNPIQQLRMKAAKPRSVVRFLSPAEEQRLRETLTARDLEHAAARRSANEWRAARKRPLFPEVPEGAYADHLTPVVLLAMNTGLRRGELLALEWSDINLQARMLTVRRENAKSGKQRHVPLNAEAVAVLRQWASQGSGSGSVFGIFGIKSSWDTLLTTARIEGFRFHDLRHHFASRLVMAGVDLNTVRELLGHADLTMTLRYAHLAPEHLAAAVERLVA
ncbi:tyrosine-type recombinase/integrase [Pseudoxanthomonas japonensis]|nr:tyrosine-type recombinase/integrase [Pseudoxanthomonas japonensis]